MHIQWTLTYPDTSIPTLTLRITEYPDNRITPYLKTEIISILMNLLVNHINPSRLQYSSFDLPILTSILIFHNLY